MPILTENNVSAHELLSETLRQMRIIFWENVTNLFFIHWVKTTFGNPKSAHDLYKSVWSYVVTHFTYADDPGDEFLTAPKYLISTKTGDCDDFALFIKTVLFIYGIDANYLLAGKDMDGFTHIAVVTPDGFILDGTNNKFNYLASEYINREITK